MVLFWLVEKNPQQLTNNIYFKFSLIFHDSHSTKKNRGASIIAQ